MSFQNKSPEKKDELSYGFSSYGVKIGLTASSREILNRIKSEVMEKLPLNPSEIRFEEAVHRFKIEYQKNGYSVIRNGEILGDKLSLDGSLKLAETFVFLAVAEFAESRVFVHAGAVSYKNKGIIFPAKSYQGKSTLTAEFVKAGAVYYSDDCAVLDENALLHPFPKQLSIRGVVENEPVQRDFPVEHFGGRAATEPVEIKLIVLTEYEQGAIWSPELLSPGNAVMEILNHTPSIQSNPKFSLEVLHKLVERAIIAKSKRDEAKMFVSDLLEFFEKSDC